MNPLPRQRKSPSAPNRRSHRRWLVAGGISVAAHVAILLPILMAAVPSPVAIPAITPIVVDLVPPSPPPPAPAPSPEPAEDPAPAGPPAPEPPAGPVRPEPPRSPPPPKVRPARRPPTTVPPVPVSAAPPRPSYATVGGAQLAGAITAGSGGSGGGGGGAGGSGSGQGGGSCDMVRRLQEALRDDPEVRDAIALAHHEAEAGSRALLVWNGDWIQNPGQEGKGLAGLRQAISVEVAFSPKACQAEPVRGLVLLTLSEGAGAPRVALGQGAWTWADLLDRRR